MKTDNELIAEFMGLDVHDYKLFGEQVRCYSVKSNDSVEVALNRHHINTLKYHSSYDALMPVLDKIERIPPLFHTRIISYADENNYLCDIVNGEDNEEITCVLSTESKLNAVYKAAVDFIKWYNEQNPNLL